MTARFALAPLVFALGLFVQARGPAERPAQPPVAPPAAQAGASTTTLDDQVELAVTVYNSDIALVRDVRDLQLARGTSDLHFMDIAATVNPATVHFRSLTEPSRVSVLEQNYEYDLLEPDKLLRKYVGRDVTLVRMRPDRRRDARGRRDGASPQLQQRAGLADRRRDRHRHAAPITSAFPSCRATSTRGRRSSGRSTTRGGARHRVEASYLAGKLSWNADYVLTVARDDKAADIDGWVTVVNGSGTSFRNATLQLVAGDLNRVRQVIGRMAVDERDAAWTMAAAAPRWRRRRSPTITSTRSAERRRSTTTRPSRSACSRAPAFPVQKRYVVDGQDVLLPQRAASGRADQGRRAGVLPVQERGEGGARHADAGRHGARVSGRLEGRRAVRRRGSHRPHAEGRNAQPEDRQRVRRRRASASRSTSRRSRATSTSSSTRSRCATTRRRRSRSR